MEAWESCWRLGAAAGLPPISNAVHANRVMDTRTQGAVRGIGEQLRHWRARRRLSQLALALQADVSSRHLSFVETGRAQPGAT